METPEVTVATITLARNATEERRISKALSHLRPYPVITADGGSRPRFIDSIHKVGAQIICPNEKGLVAQVKASLRAALDASDTPFILYTEPDKLEFFEKSLGTFLAKAKAQRNAQLVFASRDPRSLATFPSGQKRAEEFMNEATATVLNTKGDYCYGPILLTRAAATLALNAPDHLGWGWRFWLLGRASAKKLKHTTLQLSVPCPKEQRHENAPKDKVYRLKQLKQNLEGLFLGLERA